MKKKFLLFMLCGGIILGITGCGKEKTEDNDLNFENKVILKENRNIEVNSEVNLFSLVSKDNKVEIISKDEIVDTSKLGEKVLIIKYLIDNEEKEYSFKVNIVDTKAPTIECKNSLSTTEGKKIDLLNGVTAQDNSKEKIEVKVEGDYKFNKTGKYKLKYVAIDSSGNKTEEEFTLKVTAKKTSSSSSSSSKPSSNSSTNTNSTNTNSTDTNSTNTNSTGTNSTDNKNPSNDTSEKEKKVIDATIEYYCDYGTTFNRIDNTCSYEHWSVDAKVVNCPPGYEVDYGTVCKYKNPEQTTLSPIETTTCTAGDEYYVILNGVESCRAGTLTVKRTCPSGYRLSSTRFDTTTKYLCVWQSKGNVIGTISCKGGYRLDPSLNVCYKYITEDAKKKYSCPNGYTLNGEKCYED